MIPGRQARISVLLMLIDAFVSLNEDDCPTFFNWPRYHSRGFGYIPCFYPIPVNPYIDGDLSVFIANPCRAMIEATWVSLLLWLGIICWSSDLYCRCRLCDNLKLAAGMCRNDYMLWILMFQTGCSTDISLPILGLPQGCAHFFEAVRTTLIRGEGRVGRYVCVCEYGR